MEADTPLSLEDRGSWRSTAVPQVMSSPSMSFHYNLDEKPLEYTSFLHGLACGKTGFIMHHFATLSKDLLYSEKFAHPALSTLPVLSNFKSFVFSLILYTNWYVLIMMITILHFVYFCKQLLCFWHNLKFKPLGKSIIKLLFSSRWIDCIIKGYWWLPNCAYKILYMHVKRNIHI